MSAGLPRRLIVGASPCGFSRSSLHAACIGAFKSGFKRCFKNGGPESARSVFIPDACLSPLVAFTRSNIPPKAKRQLAYHDNSGASGLSEPFIGRREMSVRPIISRALFLIPQNLPRLIDLPHTLSRVRATVSIGMIFTGAFSIRGAKFLE